MIVEFLVAVGAGFAGWVGSLFPTLELPDALVNVDQGFNTVMAYGTGLGAFIDFQLVGVIAGIPIAVWIAGLTIRGARVLISHLPFIGGRG